MFPSVSRAGLRSLAALIGLVASATVGACGDATTSPAVSTPARASAAEAPAPELLATSVTFYAASRGSFYLNGNASIDVAVSCSASTTFDLIVELEQQQKAGGTKITVAAADTVPEVDCPTGSSGFRAVATPTTGAFQRGAASLRMSMDNYQPGVTPATLEQRARLAQGVE